MNDFNRYKTEILRVEDFINERPDLAIHANETILSAIKLAATMLNSICDNKISEVWNYNNPSVMDAIDGQIQAPDPSSPLYRTFFELELIKEAFVLQTQYTINLGNDYTTGATSGSLGNVNFSSSRNASQDEIAPTVLTLLQKARVYQINDMINLSSNNKCELENDFYNNCCFNIDKTCYSTDEANKKFVEEYQPNAEAGRILSVNKNHFVEWIENNDFTEQDKQDLEDTKNQAFKNEIHIQRIENEIDRLYEDIKQAGLVEFLGLWDATLTYRRGALVALEKNNILEFYISLIDDNKEPLTNDKAWGKFQFELPETQSYTKEEIDKMFADLEITLASGYQSYAKAGQVILFATSEYEALLDKLFVKENNIFRKITQNDYQIVNETMNGELGQVNLSLIDKNTLPDNGVLAQAPQHITQNNIQKFLSGGWNANLEILTKLSYMGGEKRYSTLEAVYGSGLNIRGEARPTYMFDRAATAKPQSNVMPYGLDYWNIDYYHTHSIGVDNPKAISTGAVAVLAIRFKANVYTKELGGVSDTFDASQYYTRNQTDAILSDYATKDYLNERLENLNVDLTNYYTMEQTNKLFADFKTEIEQLPHIDAYTKAEVDNKIKVVSDNFNSDINEIKTITNSQHIEINNIKNKLSFVEIRIDGTNEKISNLTKNLNDNYYNKAQVDKKLEDAAAFDSDRFYDINEMKEKYYDKQQCDEKYATKTNLDFTNTKVNDNKIKINAIEAKIPTFATIDEVSQISEQLANDYSNNEMLQTKLDALSNDIKQNDIKPLNDKIVENKALIDANKASLDTLTGRVEVLEQQKPTQERKMYFFNGETKTFETKAKASAFITKFNLVENEDFKFTPNGYYFATGDNGATLGDDWITVNNIKLANTKIAAGGFAIQPRTIFSDRPNGRFATLQVNEHYFGGFVKLSKRVDTTRSFDAESNMVLTDNVGANEDTEFNYDISHSHTFGVDKPNAYKPKYVERCEIVFLKDLERGW